MLRPLWRTLFALAAALVAFAMSERAAFAGEPSADELAMSFRNAPVSPVGPRNSAEEAPKPKADPSLERVAFRCDRRGAITVAPDVRLEARKTAVVSNEETCIPRCEGGSWERPNERPAPPPVGESYAATLAKLPTVVAAAWAPFVAVSTRGLGAGSDACRGLDRPPR